MRSRSSSSSTNAAGFFVDMVAELRAMVGMYLDTRYRMSWYGRVIPAVLFAAILSTFAWFPGLAYLWSTVSETLTGLLMKVIDLVLAYFLFKVLVWEARRYRDWLAALPSAWRG